MPTLPVNKVRQWALRTAIVVAAVLVVGSVALVLLWRDRPALDAIGWAPYPSIDPSPGAVRATWLGVATLLFDDGETQLLIDGFISRPTLADVLLGKPVESDAARINYVMDKYGMRRLAAVIPVHSHFDHAMDAGAIANRSNASILGSETMANIARGAGVPEDQIVVVEDGSQFTFGEFTVTMVHSPHAPIGWGGSVPYDGTVDEPLETPAPISAWRAGQGYAIVIEHPHGTTVVQGSAGFREQALADVQADVVMLGVQLIEGLGRKYAEQYWQALVTATGADHVFLIHFEDFTRPFGEIKPLPAFIENVVDVAGWLEEFRNTWDTDTRLHLPEFGKAVVLYPQSSPDA